jgi:hypothetical protein
MVEVQINVPEQNRSLPAIVIALLLGLSAVYWIPYYVPVRDGLSYSYMFPAVAVPLADPPYAFGRQERYNMRADESCTPLRTCSSWSILPRESVSTRICNIHAFGLTRYLGALGYAGA